MTDLAPVRRALISVSDKTDLTPFVRALVSHGVEIVSTGGTAKALEAEGVPVTHIEEFTGQPEMMGGRVKTLHPKVHGALLAIRDDPDHAAAMRDNDIKPIDLVCVNLYPFERTVARPDIAQADAIEQIDIGGPSMLRSAAKNFAHVTVVPSPRHYDRVINEMRANSGATTLALRAELASAAFARTAEYDAAIASFLSRRAAQPFPEALRLAFTKAEDLRYGENPHQDASLYRDPSSTGPTIVNAQMLHGKRLSYNNILDASSALELVKDLRRLDPDRVGAAVIKHTNPCGAASAATALEAVDLALRGDTIAAYGGILAINRVLDDAAAQRLCAEGVYLEVIAAPDYEEAALERLRAKSANLRLLRVGDRPGSPARKLMYRSIPGGMLVQDRDTRTASVDQWKHAAGPAPTEATLAHAAAVWTMAKHMHSNAIAIGGADPDARAATRLFGVGAGQMDRLTSCRIAAERAGALAKGAVAASDAFFPFDDGPRILIDAGVACILQPGGSKRDQDTIDLCDKHNVTLVLTGVRHFRH
ncbi:MAG: bifunctional phosphoribosylaminoimidazolecarboxamide formyltransferase/IMP cyclohydrolase PurH [Phycisphaerales bacterium]|nr:MAG: bifunctional phosphoribosylaminoimidazolecarboxamide formyltransferase/IMP cyclohydrolase PurH [Phycisphaerales bacterium]